MSTFVLICLAYMSITRHMEFYSTSASTNLPVRVEMAPSSAPPPISRPTSISHIVVEDFLIIMSFEPKHKVDLDPPKDDLISLDYLEKCDGSYQFPPRNDLPSCSILVV